jgi:flavin-dependent dehydrogenase
MSDKVDVLVIGAGPAGSIAAAMIHKHGFSVRVVEREKFPRFVIGESLLPRCMEALEDAGLLDVIKARGFQEKFGAKFIMDDLVSDFNFADQFSSGWGWTWQVERADFDLTLITEVQRRGVPVDFETTVKEIKFFDDETSVTTAERKDGSLLEISARFIIDASGYGRVIPRLFNLDRPSSLVPRKAVFAHVQDIHRNTFGEPNRIIIHSYAPGVWSWVIPFSNGNTSLGFVSNFEFFDRKGEDQTQQFKGCIEGDKYMRSRFSDVPWVFEPRKLEAWSTTTDKFYGNGYVLTGNVTEFLDPIFSSGVMFASVSSHLASLLVIRKLKGEKVDWDNDYTNFIRQGVDTFRTFVIAWYDGTLEKIFYSENQNPIIKRQICSVLAGYVWDDKNPFVRAHDKALKGLAKLVAVQSQK